MRLSATIIGDLERIMAEEVRAAEQAVTKGVGEATEGLKTELIAADYNPGYCDVIVERWQEATGRKAVLDGDGRTFDAVADERLARAA